MKRVHENLLRLTREELSLTAIRLGADPESLPRKADLVEAIEVGLKSRPLTPMFTVGPEGALALRRIIREDVALMDTLVHSMPVLEDSLHLLRGYGLAWHTRGRWELTQNARVLVMTLGKAQMRLLRHHDSLYTTIHGCLNLYGMMEIGEMVSLLKQSGWSGAEEGLVLSAYIAVCNPREVTFIPGGEEDAFYLCTDELDDPAWLYGELRKEGLPARALYRQADFQQADVLPGPADAFLPLQHWLSEEGATPEQTERVLYDLVFAYMNEPDAPLSVFSDMLLEYARHGKAALSHTEERMLVTLLEQLPLWTKRGHSIQGLRRLAARRSAASRDDFCPCGSGRKYGKCCGNFH